MANESRKPGNKQSESTTVIGRQLFRHRHAQVARQAEMRHRQRLEVIDLARKRVLKRILNREKSRTGPRPVD